MNEKELTGWLASPGVKIGSGRFEFRSSAVLTGSCNDSLPPV